MNENEELDVRVLRAVSSDPEMLECQIAHTAGISLGAVNDCLKAPAENGIAKL